MEGSPTEPIGFDQTSGALERDVSITGRGIILLLKADKNVSPSKGTEGKLEHKVMSLKSQT